MLIGKGKVALLGVVLLLLVVGCTDESLTPTPLAPSATAVSPTITLTNTAIPSTTSTPSPTATATTIPSPTPTPTATAVSITIAPKAQPTAESEPERNGRYPCGAVDTFDFPIDPPHADRVSRGGGDFGVFRGRYDKYHAGEDWGGASDRASNLGTPVHSIGHGLVTYAQPLGWGRDQGVIILQHTFSDGSTILSFYGHLDPESVLLTPGRCVQRGEQIGKIGQPRGFPHLHFEMRSQSPYTPLTGYWPEDPTLNGWIWPSQMIWNQRVAIAPGVGWSRPFTGSSVHPIGLLDEYLLLLEGDQVTAVDRQNGAQKTIALGVERLAAALVDAPSSLLYTANHSGQINTFRMPQGLASVPEPGWQVDLDEIGLAQLLPLPQGGVIAVWHSKLYAISEGGELLWQTDVGQRPISWHLLPDALYFSTGGDEGTLWQVKGGQRPLPLVTPSGKLAYSDEWLWIYSQDGLYRLAIDKETDEAEKVFELPQGSFAQGDIQTLANGEVLVYHLDPNDKRLIALTADGALLWERSLRDLPISKHHLVILENQPYLMTQANGVNGDTVVYAIDMDTATLNQLFTGGTRTALPNETWTFPVNNTALIINIGGGPMAFFDPQATQTASPQ